jgi:DNA-binding FrmR family transcriptional regulator
MKPYPPRGDGGEEEVMKVYQRELEDRLRSIEGHVGGVRRMVEEDRYCVDIVRQVQAVQRALDRVNALLLEGHLQTCVIRAIRDEDPAERERVIGELREVFEAARTLRGGGNHGQA